MADFNSNQFGTYYPIPLRDVKQEWPPERQHYNPTSRKNRRNRRNKRNNIRRPPSWVRRQINHDMRLRHARYAAYHAAEDEPQPPFRERRFLPPLPMMPHGPAYGHQMRHPPARGLLPPPPPQPLFPSRRQHFLPPIDRKSYSPQEPVPRWRELQLEDQMKLETWRNDYENVYTPLQHYSYDLLSDQQRIQVYEEELERQRLWMQQQILKEEPDLPQPMMERPFERQEDYNAVPFQNSLQQLGMPRGHQQWSTDVMPEYAPAKVEIIQYPSSSQNDDPSHYLAASFHDAALYETAPVFDPAQYPAVYGGASEFSVAQPDIPVNYANSWRI